jgi:beta-lactamase class A
LLIAVLVLAGCGGGDDTSTTHPDASDPPPNSETMVPDDGQGRPGDGGEEVLSPAALRELEDHLDAAPGEVGVAVSPLGGGEPVVAGEAMTGRAWSTMKVPLLVALINRVGGADELSASERSQAEAAITASDNEAASALFDRLQDLEGGLVPASRAIEDVLRDAGDDETTVNTEPSPEGFSTYGQTEWSAAASTRFFAALTAGCLLDDSDTDYVLSLMEDVVPDQRWGLGRGSAPAGTAVAFKGGWGPEDGGGYLVRQGGTVEAGNGGYALTVIAIPDETGTGSFPAGQDLVTEVADLVTENAGAGPRATVTCPR